MRSIVLAAVLFLPVFLRAESPAPYLVNKKAVATTGAKDQATLHEGTSAIVVTAQAPVPAEITDKSLAQSVAKEAAIGIGRTHLMRYVLKKKTHTKKTLADAMIPSVDLQKSVKDLVDGAEVKNVEWKTDQCVVTLSLSKDKLAKILRGA